MRPHARFVKKYGEGGRKSETRADAPLFPTAHVIMDPSAEEVANSFSDPGLKSRDVTSLSWPSKTKVRMSMSLPSGRLLRSQSAAELSPDVVTSLFPDRKRPLQTYPSWPSREWRSLPLGSSLLGSCQTVATLSRPPLAHMLVPSCDASANMTHALLSGIRCFLRDSMQSQMITFPSWDAVSVLSESGSHVMLTIFPKWPLRYRFGLSLPVAQPGCVAASPPKQLPTAFSLTFLFTFIARSSISALTSLIRAFSSGFVMPSYAIFLKQSTRVNR